jgi:hypothetical protein
MRYAEWGEEPERDTLPDAQPGAPTFVFADDDDAMPHRARPRRIDVVEVASEVERAGATLLAKPFRLDTLRTLVLATRAEQAGGRAT